MIIKSIINNIPIRVYGDGSNVRDWIYVLDHCIAVDLIYNKGEKGSIYNIAGKNEMTNLEMIDMIYSIIGNKFVKSINFDVAKSFIFSIEIGLPIKDIFEDLIPYEINKSKI